MVFFSGVSLYLFLLSEICKYFIIRNYEIITKVCELCCVITQVQFVNN